MTELSLITTQLKTLADVDTDGAVRDVQLGGAARS
jgi:hypothetical protein